MSSHDRGARVLRRTVILALTTAFGLALPAGAADVVALRLPRDFTVRPEGEASLVALAPDGSVAALAESTDRLQRSHAVRWDANGRRTIFTALPVLTAPDKGADIGNTTAAAGAVAASGVIYVHVSERFSGAYSGTSFEAQRWVGNGSQRWNLAGCKAGSNTDQLATAADGDGRVAVTFERTGASAYTVMGAGKEAAPYAFIVDSNGCHALGRAVILDVRGSWASGYRGYLGRELATTNFGTIQQRSVAVRWHGNVLSELGDGAAYAVNDSGLAVGATAVAGRFDSATEASSNRPSRLYVSPVPHAVVWTAAGHREAIETGAARSIAYDVAKDGTIVGLLQTRAGKHYAFRRYRTHLQRLDDLPHPAGWRFESAYAIADDGTIAGIGTLNDVATVFTWKP